MNRITLTAEQAQIVLQASSPVTVCDDKGRTVATLTPLDPADIEAIERSKRNRAAGEPLIPSEHVQAHLRRLEEICQSEGMDEAKMLDLLRRMQAGEQV
jgi:antitoxin (DNA-binding transcriptional repressor) of toxin-antitoxin stability system